jgi:ATP-dependent Clp protease ATP-binding subunit ClpC
MEHQMDPLIGRGEELDAMIQILCSRKNNNPLLLGERGVGKTTIVHGLAQRITDGEAPLLANRRILELDLSLIVVGTKYRGQFEERLKTIMMQLLESQNSIIFIDELHTLVGDAAVEGTRDAASILKSALSRGKVQCISEMTPTDYPEVVRKLPWLGHHSQVVNVLPPTPQEALQVLKGLKDIYEKYHEVSYTDDALLYAVRYSNRYMPDHHLPAKAIDVLDAAGSRVKLRQVAPPEDIIEVQKRIKFIVHRMENAIANHEFEKARFYSDEERKEREKLRVLREKYHLDESSTGVVGREDVEDVVLRRTGVSIASLREGISSEPPIDE